MFLGLTVLLIPLIGVLLYNSLIGKKNEVKNAMGGLDAQLKQRYDLIPNLVSTVRQYMNHEASLLQKIVELRSQVLKKDISHELKQEVNQEISKTLGTLMVQVENYPDLKASTSFLELQKTLTSVEENIAASRRFYNSAVTDYNNALEMFPSNLFAKMMNLEKEEVFNIPEAERKNVSVEELFNRRAS